MSKRTPVIAGNWKMNLTVAEAIQLVKGIGYGHPFPGEVDVIVAPPLVMMARLADLLKDSYIAVAAQNMHQEEKGAYTGECSGSQVREAGADYVIIGHSERRQYFGETDETVNKKIKAALKNRLIPIVCIGETGEERERGEESAVIGRQLAQGLAGFTPVEVAAMLIAYEPVWAIGTGKTATPAQVEDIHRLIRYTVSSTFSGEAGGAVRILYGGSVKPGNSTQLLALPNVDGALVGGASLKIQDFIDIIKSAGSGALGA
jgi:triosephosphate isomerase (TIM)